MEQKIVNITENDALLIRVALALYIDSFDDCTSPSHPFIQRIIDRCKRLDAIFDEFLKHNN